MKKNWISTSALAAGILFAMNGCGGGSGSDPIEEETPSKVSGVAVDDLILNGIVTATDAELNVLAEGRTSATDGTYTLNVNHDGVVLLNVRCDENSTMWNPALDISTAVACDESISLNSVLDASPGVDQIVNISPLTEIVYQRASALAGGGNMDETGFQEARSEIGLMFGIDPVADNPVGDDTYAAIIEAIHTVAEETNSTVMEVTEGLRTALEDGVAEGEEVIMALVAALKNTNTTIPLTVNEGNMTVPENPSTLSDIDSAKALFDELRTQAMSVVDYQNSGTPGFLDSEAEEMNSAVNNITMDVEAIEELLTYMSWDIEYMLENNLTEYQIYKMTAPGTLTYHFTDENEMYTYSGTVSIPAFLLDDTNETMVYDDFGTLRAEIDGTLPLDLYSIGEEMEEGVENIQSFTGAIEVTKTTAGADVSINGTIASNGTTFIVKEANAEVAYSEGEPNREGTFEPKFDYFKLQNASVQGVVGVYTIDGDIIVNSYVQNSILAENGGIVEEATTYFAGDVICYDAHDSSEPYGNGTIQITMADGGSTQVTTNGSGYFHGELSGYYEYSDFETAYDSLVYENGICPDGYTPVTSLNYTETHSDSTLTNSGWLPSDVTFTGAISREGAAIDGTIHAEWINAETFNPDVDEVYMPLVKVSVGGTLQMPERPEMAIALSFENNATNNMLTASYSYDATLINMSAVSDTEMNNVDVEITTPMGLRADITVEKDAPVTGTLTKDGGLVGTFEEREGMPIIKYIDGTFESLP
ncbi:MAG: hypothetical protein ABXS91_04785 [Sulfurimonas sp.]